MHWVTLKIHMIFHKIQEAVKYNSQIRFSLVKNQLPMMISYDIALVVLMVSVLYISVPINRSV